MKTKRCRSLLAALLFAAIPAGAQTPALQFAELGDCPLEGGDTIRDCRIGYRTAGVLNAERSNAILVPSWHIGSSESLQSLIGPGRLLDTSHYFVIAVDAFGNGVSSSPTNSKAQAGAAFPRFGIRDIVHAQRRLVRNVLGIERLHAVVGLSMGGMQAFEWAVTYPEMMRKVVPIVGSPRLTSYDVLLWEAELRLIEAGERCDCVDVPSILTLIDHLTIQTPELRSRQTPRDSADAFLRRIVEQYRRVHRGPDRASQLRAMIAHDVSQPFGGLMERAAERVRAEMLVVIAARDLTVNPEPSRRFAALAKAEVLELEGDCGHVAPTCERERMAARLEEFLER